MFALKRLVQISSKPDLVILNMGIWVRDWTASGQDYKERFETILQHGNYFRNDTGAHTQIAAGSACKLLLLPPECSVGCWGGG